MPITKPPCGKIIEIDVVTDAGSVLEQPAIIVITGLMASGKSTVAQALAQRLPLAAHVRGDAFRWMIVSGRAELTPPLTAAARA
ncbi:MAG: adenylyl-sulfate kinase [Pseudonocardiaceae bacterium]